MTEPEGPPYGSPAAGSPSGDPRRWAENTDMKIGDTVTLTRLPEWVDQLPHESMLAFSACVGKSFKIIEIDNNGLLVLDVSEEIDRTYGGIMNDIRVEANYLNKG